MNKQVKRILSLVLALAMCVALFAACGNDSGSSSSSTASTGEDKSSSTPESSTAGGDESSTPEGGETGTGEKLDVLNISEPMDLSIAVMTGFTQSDSRVEKMLEEKYNVNIELVVIPGWADGQSFINLRMAADDTPNIMWWWGMDNDFLQW